MSLEKLVVQTQEKFPPYQHARVEISPLEKGGSDRKFYRVIAGPEHKLILVKYSGHKEENRHYVDIARYLESVGVNVPRIHFHDPEEGLIWMQDLGELDLWHWRNEPWEIRKPLYESTLLEVSKMHTAATRRIEEANLKLELEFSDQLYLWEQNYFFDYCLRDHFQMDEASVRRYGSLPIFRNIATRLSSLPRVLVHRDFQSQNVLILEGSAWLIDFQGMRPGLPQYDLASLLYDRLCDTERYRAHGPSRTLQTRGTTRRIGNHRRFRRGLPSLRASASHAGARSLRLPRSPQRQAGLSPTHPRRAPLPARGRREDRRPG